MGVLAPLSLATNNPSNRYNRYHRIAVSTVPAVLVRTSKFANANSSSFSRTLTALRCPMHAAQTKG
ncbi:hypothetical protein RMSM_06343 [Rhodopirellula maiorica SM1]|uniref:Uncharacterized protein n=1 Tax=Rhodopirellula maiorica SM1 TaxID=1265738 RepID=M5RCF3_9BACT|nr:hypothetical protein RMSM_06343 [Rhodopirellula maiorica SM1]